MRRIGPRRRVRDTRSPRVAPYNAPTYLADMPSPYGGSQFVHPDVVYVPAGWNGYPYWMAVTPYPGGANDKENPSILASYDGRSWETPRGLRNPVVGAAGGYNSDTDLTLSPNGTTLQMVHRRNATVEELWALTSTNGVSWSTPTKILDNGPGSGYIAPSVIWNGTQWVMYAVNQNVDPATIRRWTAPAITGPWTGPSAVSYPYTPASDKVYEPWHIDALYYGGRVLIISNEQLDDGSGFRVLRLLSSPDGVNFTAAPTPLMEGGLTGKWDEGPYRATGVIEQSAGVDVLRLWYSALAITSNEWHVGYTEIPATDTARYFPA